MGRLLYELRRILPWRNRKQESTRHSCSCLPVQAPLPVLRSAQNSITSSTASSPATSYSISRDIITATEIATACPSTSAFRSKRSSRATRRRTTTGSRHPTQPWIAPSTRPSVSLVIGSSTNATIVTRTGAERKLGASPGVGTARLEAARATSSVERRLNSLSQAPRVLSMTPMTSEPISDQSACPECGAPDVTDTLTAETAETIVTDEIALTSHPVHVIRLKCKRGHVWSPAKPRDSA